MVALQIAGLLVLALWVACALIADAGEPPTSRPAGPFDQESSAAIEDELAWFRTAHRSPAR